ncbi:fasciclin domain-containing protein [Noviherbaspirillum agri]
MKKLIPLLLAALLAASASAADLVGTAKRSSEISHFVEAVQIAGLSDTLRQRGPFTVFAPSDSAFNQLPQEEKKALLSDRETAAKFVSDHVIPGKHMVMDIKPGETQTIDGSKLHVKSDNGLVRVEDASVIQSDLDADNGVIHIVDKVIHTEK